MKKMFSVLAVVLFMSSSLNLNAKQVVERSYCSEFALLMGTLSEDAGGSFYEAYFSAYASCLADEYSLQP